MKKILIIVFALLSGLLIAFWLLPKSADLPNPTQISLEKERILQGNSLSGRPKPIELADRQLLPVHIQDLLDQEQPLDPSAIFNTNPLDKEILMELYRSTPLAERGKLMWALAAIGDDETVGLFRHTLLDEFREVDLTEDEGRAMSSTVSAFGMLSAKNDSAFNFLREAANYDFWRNNRKWTSSAYGDVDRLLVTRCIQALGVSGRSEVPTVLEDLAREHSANLRMLAGAFVDAAFYYDITIQEGMEGAVKETFSNDDTLQRFSKWRTETETGRKWREWSLDVKTIPIKDIAEPNTP